MSKETPEVLADNFITEMIEETGCSITFLNEAKPSIIRLFRDTEGSVQADCVAAIRETIQSQADIEKASAKVRGSTGTAQPQIIAFSPAG